MSAQPPPSNPNPLDEFKSGVKESPPHQEFMSGIADKQPMLQDNKPRYAFGWFDKWLLAIPIILLIVLLVLAWRGINLQQLAGQATKVSSNTTDTPSPNQTLAATSVAAQATAAQTTSAQNPAQATNAAQTSSAQNPAQATNAAATSAASSGNGTALPNATLNGTSVANNSNQIISLAPPSGGTTVTVGQPITLGGTAPPGTQVDLYNSDNLIATTTADANGNYEFTLSPNEPGEYQLKTVATVNGQRVESAVVTITVQSAAASAATSTAIAAQPPAMQTSIAQTAAPATSAASSSENTPSANETVQPTQIAQATSDVSAITNTPSANETASATSTANAEIIAIQPPAAGTTVTAGQAFLIQGTAPPGSTVELYNYDILLGATTADANGNFVFNIMPVAPGDYQLVAVTMVDGQRVTSPPLALTVQPAQGGTAEATNVASAGANGTATPTANGAAAQNTAVAQGTAVAPTPANGANANNSDSPTIELPAGNVFAGGSILTGTAPPNSHVEIYFNDIKIAEATADANGNWKAELPKDLASGNYSVVIVVTGQDGKTVVSSSDAVNAQVISKPLLPVTGGNPP